MKSKIISQKILTYAKKTKSIKYKGGCCKICKETNIFKLTFHHIDISEKEFEYSDYKNYRCKIIKIFRTILFIYNILQIKLLIIKLN